MDEDEHEDYCDGTKHLRIDPYAAEIYDVHTLVDICDCHYNVRREEI